MQRKLHGAMAYCSLIAHTSLVLLRLFACGRSSWKHADRCRFEKGLDELVKVLCPHTIIVYGSASYPCFDKLIKQGIKIISYPSHSAQTFKRGKK